MTQLEKLKMKAKLLVKARSRAGTPIPLKDALNAVARLSGFSSWRELRKSPPPQNLQDLYAGPTGIFPNLWCKTYEEARAVQKQSGGFLLPYRKQYFVCQLDYVVGLGIQPDDPDLQLVGPDWAEPRDAQALQRLNAKIQVKVR